MKTLGVPSAANPRVPVVSDSQISPFVGLTATPLMPGKTSPGVPICLKSWPVAVNSRTLCFIPSATTTLPLGPMATASGLSSEPGSLSPSTWMP